MSKAVMMSIQPKWCELIANGKKTIEVRKTRPKLEMPFKVYIYCTRGDALACPCLNMPKYTIHRMNDGTLKGRRMTAEEREKSDYLFANGKVIGEFVCDKVFDIYKFSGSRFWLNETLVKATCLTEKEINDYGKGKDIFGWHISDLVIYDEPKELSEFTALRKTKFGYEPVEVKRPPQSWCYVEESK